jgi:hypothetical protein
MAGVRDCERGVALRWLETHPQGGIDPDLGAYP